MAIIYIYLYPFLFIQSIFRLINYQLIESIRKRKTDPVTKRRSQPIIRICDNYNNRKIQSKVKNAVLKRPNRKSKQKPTKMLKMNGFFDFKSVNNNNKKKH